MGWAWGGGGVVGMWGRKQKVLTVQLDLKVPSLFTVMIFEQIKNKFELTPSLAKRKLSVGKLLAKIYPFLFLNHIVLPHLKNALDDEVAWVDWCSSQFQGLTINGSPKIKSGMQKNPYFWA